MKPLDPRLLRYSRSSRGFVFFSVVLALLGAMASLAQAILLATIIVDLFQHHRRIDQIAHHTSYLAAVFAVKALLGYLTSTLGARFSSKIKSELRAALIEQTIGEGGTQTLREIGPSGLSLLLTRGINNLDGYFSKFIPQLFIASTVPVIVGAAIAYTDWRSGITILLTVPLIPLFGIFIGKYTARATEKKLATLDKLSAYFLDLITGLSTLKVNGRAAVQEETIGKVGDRYRRETMKVLKISFLSSLALELVATLSVALLAVSIGLRLVNGHITLFSGLFVLILAPEVYWPIRQVSAHFHAVADGVAVSNQIFEILEQPLPAPGQQISGIDQISWSELTVRYDGRSEIVIPAGRLVPRQINALVGPSGAGKSTLISILLGFTKYEGVVEIKDGANKFELRDLDLRAYRKFISWMPQEPIFAAATVGDLVDHDANNLILAGLDVEDLPGGLNTPTGSFTEALSQGQRRKLALARALAKDCPILLLDEPAASVDDLSEEQISNTLQSQIANGRTILVSSHRPTVIGAAGNTIVISR